MATLTLSVWRDTGYTEGTLEVPSKTSSLPTPTFTFSNLHPSRDKLFSESQVPHAYEDLYDCSYVRAVIDMNNGDDVTVYGWIDSVTASSDTPNSPMTIIRWHIDYWRTYLSKATFKGGLVKRRPLLKDEEGKDIDSYPPQSYPVRYMTVDGTPVDITRPQSYWWVLATLSTTKFQGDPMISIAFPVSASSPSTNITISVNNYHAPSFNDLITGYWIAELGLDPASIYGVFLSPISPNVNMSAWGAFGNTYKPETGTEATYGSYMATSLNALSEYSVTGVADITPSDTENYVITGFDGEVIGSLPWGINVTQWTYRVILDTSSAYIQIRFDGIDSHAEGLCFTIPLITVPVGANAWSSYVYSGARQADIMQMRAETEKAGLSGLASAGTSALTGAASGAMLGAIGGPIGVAGGAALGAVTSSGAGLLNTATTYGVSSKYNDVFQDITDYRMAHQSNGLLMSGTGFDNARFGNSEIKLVKLVPDSYSVDVRAVDIEMYGVHVSEPVTSTQSLINAGGPLQIANLTVTGSIPVEAKQYFRERFAGGVRIV